MSQIKPFWIIVISLLSLSIVGVLWASFTLISQPETDKLVQYVEPLPTEFCWNKVVEVEGETPYWPDACNTAETAKDEICAQVIQPLNEAQLQEYEGWKVAGKPKLIGC